MKTILITIALLIGLSAPAQDYLLTKYYIVINGDTARTEVYIYDANQKLDSAYYHSTDRLMYKIDYSNDTMLSYEGADWSAAEGTSGYYEYFDDSITIAHLNEGVEIGKYNTYHLNEQDQVVRNEFQGNDPYYTDIFQVWEGDNVVEQSLVKASDTTTHTFTYYDYISPEYAISRFLRSNYSNSYNQPKAMYDLDGEELYYFDVVDLVDNYPLQIDLYVYGEYKQSFFYEYDIVSNTPELLSEPATVLSVGYYDLMGRRIPKPTKGFYIARKTTDKGIISTKHFIQ